ncbi:MAG TPA: hypothetical protein VFA83_24120 [Acidimicrobiales bacterium]|nr:hypothetical protein [Acidimicrobiales bacterium]
MPAVEHDSPLSPLDDYPVHQISEPMRHVGTGDRNFYDRYYFNAHTKNAEIFLIAGVGQYPNLGVSDAFVLVLHEQQQRVVRASRELGADRMDTGVGPIHVEVKEGLKVVKLVCDPNEFGIECELTWTGASIAHLEPRHFIRRYGRVTFDSSRFAQTGCWSGHLVVDGKEFNVTPDKWWGTRDRSWGIRPVGEPEPPGIQYSRGLPTFFWNYAPMQFDNYSILYILQEEPDGTRIMEEAVRVYPIESGLAPDSLGKPEHELEFLPGTRDIAKAKLHFTETDGSPLTVTVERLLPCHLGVGTGYGFDADWRHGMWQGPLKVEGVHFDLTKPDDAAKMMGIVDSVARFTTSTGDVGYGLWEYFVLGPHDRYGFKGWDDVAP